MLATTCAPARARSVAGGPGLPDVLADRGPDQALADAEQDQIAAGLEVPILVEDSVVRQEALVVEGLDLSVRTHRAGVVEVALEVRRADEAGDSLGLGCDQREAALGRAEKAGTEQEILGRVAGDGQLGEEHEVGARGPRLLEPGHDLLPVPVEVADDRVDLGEREPHGLRLGG